MCESTVSLSHTVHVLLTLEGTTLVVVSVHNLSGQLLSHALSAALAGEEDHVLHRHALLTVGANLCRHLEGSTTDTAALHLHLRSDVVEGLLPDLQGSLLLLGSLLLHNVEGVVEDAVRDALLTIVHQVVNKL